MYMYVYLCVVCVLGSRFNATKRGFDGNGGDKDRDKEKERDKEKDRDRQTPSKHTDKSRQNNRFSNT